MSDTLNAFMLEYPYNALMSLRGSINDLQMEERLTKRAQDKLCYIDSQLLDAANFLYRLRREMIEQEVVMP